MAKYALIKDDVVANIIELDPLLASSWNLPGYEKVFLAANGQSTVYGVGCLYSNGTFNFPPEEDPIIVVPEVISDRQFFQQLSTLGVITQEEALQAVQVGAIPTQMNTMIAQLPQEQQFGARMLLSGATEFKRHNPIVAVFAAAYGWTDQQTDQFWIAASQV